MQNQNHNKQLFKKMKAEGKSEGMIYLSNGKIFYGRVLRENPLTVIGFKNKKCLIVCNK